MKFSNLSFASLSIDSSTCVDFICGANGLPSTPKSITIIGNFKAFVEHVDHPNLIKYVECLRSKNERVTLVFENLKSQAPENVDPLKVAGQLFDALYHLHHVVDCVHGLITPDCFMWSTTDDLKLAHWPISLLTEGGLSLGAASIRAFNISYLSPEQVISSRQQATQQSDIWSAGLSLLKLIKPDLKLPDNPRRLACCDNYNQVIEIIDGNLDETLVANPKIWNALFSKMLDPDPNTRATLHETYSLLNLDFPRETKFITWKPIVSNEFELRQEKLFSLTVSELYYLWRLSIGRNFESGQKQDDFPPIFKIPYLIVGEAVANSSEEFQLKNHVLIDTRPKPISLDVFIADLNSLDEKIFHPLILTDEELLVSEEHRCSSESISNGSTTQGSQCNSKQVSIKSFKFADLDNLSLRSIIQARISEESKIQPVVIKEANFAYQCERIVLFKRLLHGYPFLKDQLCREASVDIPPYYRAQTWALLLGVSPERSEILYASIDKTTPLATDRQISVDIPRCHQYNELMASPQGHQKLARILKTWLNHHTSEYVYWQGLDSLAAPFLLLNFHNEAMAFACFDAFVEKYLKGFFSKDNQIIVQRYLAMFSELLSYHDGSLADHLESLGFLPNLYAIPWFLTMFTHVLPLHKILHVWDCLILGDARFPLCIGLAVLNQLRQELMGYSFNDCIVAFSDLPEIDIERCVKDATHFYNSTPDRLINLTEVADSQPS